MYEDYWEIIATESKSRIQTFWFNILKRLRLVKINRNFLVFLVFLCISILFWFLTTLKEDTSAKFNYKLTITEIPKNIIITSDIPESISATINGRGYDIIRYWWSDIIRYWWSEKNPTLTISFKELSKKNGSCLIEQKDFRKFIGIDAQNNTLSLASSQPSSIQLYFSEGYSKRVPVVFGGKATPGIQHIFNGVQIFPDSVEIIAPKRLLDSIRDIHTVPVLERNLQDTIQKYVKLEKITGVKISVDSVLVKYCVDVFTEKTLTVSNIYSENIPQNKQLKTFPSSVKVKFHVSAAMYESIKPEDFIIAIDFNTIKPGDRTCKLNLREYPDGITHVSLQPEDVEYVIEQVQVQPM